MSEITSGENCVISDKREKPPVSTATVPGRRRAGHWIRPAVTVPLEARLEGETADYTEVSLESRSQRGQMHEVLVARDGGVTCDCLAATHHRQCWHQRDAAWLVDQAAAVLAEYASIKASKLGYLAEQEAAYRESCRAQLRHIAWRVRQRGYELARITDWAGGVA